MKRIIYTLAIAALGFASCQKEDFKPEDLGKRTADTVEVDTTSYYIIRDEYGFYNMEVDRRGNATDIIKHYSSYELPESLIFVQESKDVMDAIISTGRTLGMGNEIHTNLFRVEYNDGKLDTVDCGWYLSKRFCCRVIEDWWHCRNLKDHNYDAVLDDKTAEAFDIIIKLFMSLDDLDSRLIVAYDRNPDDPRSADDRIMFLKDFIDDVQGKSMWGYTYIPYVYDFGVTFKKIQ